MEKHIISLKSFSESGGHLQASSTRSCLPTSVTLTSEDPFFILENAIEGKSPGWRAAGSGRQLIRFEFSPPISLETITVKFETHERRTQEFRLSASADGGVSFQEIVRQQFNFAENCTVEHENFTVKREGVCAVEIMIWPDIRGGSALATLASIGFQCRGETAKPTPTGSA